MTKIDNEAPRALETRGRREIVLYHRMPTMWHVFSLSSVFITFTGAALLGIYGIPWLVMVGMLGTSVSWMWYWESRKTIKEAADQISGRRHDTMITWRTPLRDYEEAHLRAILHAYIDNAESGELTDIFEILYREPLTDKEQAIKHSFLVQHPKLRTMK